MIYDIFPEDQEAYIKIQLFFCSSKVPLNSSLYKYHFIPQFIWRDRENSAF